jgi:hypothetical protein
MKNLCLILLILFTLNVFAQPHKGRGNMISNFAFQQLIANLNSKTDDAQKLEMAKKIVNENKLSSEQIKKIAETFGNDNSRLEFAETAYNNTTDKENFYEVYNAFSYFSSVFRLHDYVTQLRGGTNIVNDVPDLKVMSFPNYDYPDFRKYFGKIGCTNVISDQDFTSLAEKVFNETSEDKKLALANNISYSNCLQTAQAMKIASLLQNESSRLDFLKKARTKVFDPDNYKFAGQVFTSDNYSKEFSSFVGSSVSTNVSNNPPCEVNQKDFADVKNQIIKQSFNNTKINVAKENIRSRKCFKTSQIIEVLALFSYEDSKMDIAKFAYDYVTDKENYVKVADSFSFSTNKDSFLDFLKRKN